MQEINYDESEDNTELELLLELMISLFGPFPLQS